MAFKRGGQNGIKNLALIDFSSGQTDRVHHGGPRLTAVAHRQRHSDVVLADGLKLSIVRFE